MIDYTNYNVILFTEIEDIANATLFLLSDKADMISGIITPVDGGNSAIL